MGLGDCRRRNFRGALLLGASISAQLGCLLPPLSAKGILGEAKELGGAWATARMGRTQGLRVCLKRQGVGGAHEHACGGSSGWGLEICALRGLASGGGEGVIPAAEGGKLGVGDTATLSRETGCENARAKLRIWNKMKKNGYNGAWSKVSSLRCNCVWFQAGRAAETRCTTLLFALVQGLP